MGRQRSTGSPAGAIRGEARAGRLARLRVALRLFRSVCEELDGPALDLPSGFRFRHAIAFLDLARHLLDVTLDLLHVVMREFSPLVAYAPTQLLPIALNPVI